MKFLFDYCIYSNHLNRNILVNISINFWSLQAKLWARVTSGTSIAGGHKIELHVVVIGRQWAMRKQ